MRQSERGFTLIEVLVVVAIVALIVSGAAMATFQVINVTKRSNDHMTVTRQVQNAGYWISHDALMAEYVTVGDNPETGAFLTLNWTEWSYDEYEASIYHTAVYTFHDLSGGIGKLQRNHWIDAVVSEQTLVAEYIDLANTEAEDNGFVLTLQITASLGEAEEIREYRVKYRPDF